MLSSPDWIIPYEKLVIDGSIGSGAFGHVNKAYLSDKPVAVKTLQCKVITPAVRLSRDIIEQVIHLMRTLLRKKL